MEYGLQEHTQCISGWHGYHSDHQYISEQSSWAHEQYWTSDPYQLLPKPDNIEHHQISHKAPRG